MNFDFSDLVDQKLVVVRESAKYPGLSVAKYSKKVFFKNLWLTDERLLDARGVVLDENNRVVIWPFTKVFNRFENGTDLDRDTPVIAVRKINGFMAAARHYRGKLLVSTTGSLDSDFAVLAREHLKKYNIEPGATYLFEICDPLDPHIVSEESGAYLIGKRCMTTGAMATEEELDVVATKALFMRPEWFRCRMSDVTKTVASVKHEGFMIRLDDETQDTVMKIKSVHYLTKKFIMRMSKKNIELMYQDPIAFRENIDEEFYGIVDYIVSTIDLDKWLSTDPIAKRCVIESYFRGETQ
jgi:hypothetical protein